MEICPAELDGIGQRLQELRGRGESVWVARFLAERTFAAITARDAQRTVPHKEVKMFRFRHFAASAVVGVPDADSHVYKAGYVEQDELDALHASGVVGDIATVFGGRISLDEQARAAVARGERQEEVHP